MKPVAKSYGIVPQAAKSMASQDYSSTGRKRGRLCFISLIGQKLAPAFPDGECVGSS